MCSLRVACNTRRKDNSTGEWVDKPNYFDVTVWGAQGENCARYLSKGRPVAINGRLEWREWETQEGGKRQAVEIIAESVQFLGGRDDAGPGNGGGGGGFTPRSRRPGRRPGLQGLAGAPRPAAAAPLPTTTSPSRRRDRRSVEERRPSGRRSVRTASENRLAARSRYPLVRIARWG